MQQLKGFLDFLKKNRIIIYVMLGLALTMQVVVLLTLVRNKVNLFILIIQFLNILNNQYNSQKLMKNHRILI